MGNCSYHIYLIDVDDPYEIVVHRAIWSAVLLFLICWIGRLAEVWTIMRVHQNFYNFFVTAGLLSLNWGIYVYAGRPNNLLQRRSVILSIRYAQLCWVSWCLGKT